MEACFMHARVAMCSQLLTTFLLKGVIYDLSVIHIFRLSHTATNKRLLIMILLAFRERDKPNWSLFVTTCTKMLRHYASRNL